ncbi:DUF2897 family protein [Pseudomonas lalucatii]|uniref:DUF2897 family protein n=1 Tax=Pseudomonas lalucatii TaxID=1424203 RepID=A0ABS5PY92_9PSED|nr:DUF2897 family protein [Pseudomonas lalucatii]MBS7661168.1 DUF2897 family protein [Pseudomonas lalucatii]MBS7691646.1 DUF2897 family protein [Pseudomonas lalucatii]MBS7724248.1 DUF2897 family protein [Pseudomonas lalucatii]QVM87764.1 DUF2897 family protein [Pseudomonas lalucatii]
MPWYAWLLMTLILGSIVGGLLVLLRTAKPLPLNEEQLRKIRERQIEMEARDAKDAGRR